MVQNDTDLADWRDAVLKSSLDHQTKLALTVVSYQIDTDEWVARINQSDLIAEFQLTKSTFNRYWTGAKETEFVDVLDSRPPSKARWDDDPWTDKLVLLIPD